MISSAFERPLFIYNPVAGTSNATRVQRAFEDACERYGWQPETHETQKGEDLAQVVRQYLEKGCDVVLAGGGDGTVSAVASGLVGTQVPLAVIPIGTANFLARQLALPLQLTRAFDLVGGQPEIFVLDAMKIEEHYHVLNASAGFSSALIQNTSREDKRRFGFLAYVWTGARVLVGLQPYRFELVVDGEPHTMRASEVFISESALIKDEVLLSVLDIHAEEGQLEVFVIKARTVWDYVLLLWDVLMGRARRSHRMSHFPVRHQIEIAANKLVTFQADGEVIGETPVTVQVVKGAVRVLVPKAGK